MLIKKVIQKVLKILNEGMKKKFNLSLLNFNYFCFLNLGGQTVFGTSKTQLNIKWKSIFVNKNFFFTIKKKLFKNNKKI